MDQAQNNAQVQKIALPPQLPPPPPPPGQIPQPVLPVVPPAGQVPIVQAQVNQNPNGNINLKLQQTKLPDFWGQKEKDSISAYKFVKRVDKIHSNTKKYTCNTQNTLT